MAVETKRGVTLPRPVELVNPEGLPFVKAWRGFKPDHPIAVAWTVLAERRPHDARLHLEDKTTGQIGITTTPELSRVLQRAYESPDMHAIEAVHFEGRGLGDTDAIVESVGKASWTPQTKQSAVLLALSERSRYCHAKTERLLASEKRAKEQFESHRSSDHPITLSAHSSITEEMDYQEWTSASRERSKWQELANQYEERMEELRFEGANPLSIDELYGLIADVVDAALTTSQTA